MTSDADSASTIGSPGEAVTVRERWLARGAFVAALGAVIALLVGGRGGIAVLFVGVAGLAAALAGVWWFVSNRGVRRWLAAALVVAALIAVIVFYVSQQRLLDIAVVLVLAGVAGSLARAAVARSRPAGGPPEHHVPHRAGRT